MTCPRARCSADLWNQGERTRRLLASFHPEITCTAFSGRCVVFPQLPHTQNPHTVIQQHTGIWSTTLWIGKLCLIFCHQETNFDMLISQKSEQKKSLCNKKARLFQIQRKDDLCWTHDTMLLMREREDNKSSQHWTDTRKAISLAFTDICKLLTQTTDV